MTAELKRTLGFWSCFSVAVGCVVASSTLVSLGQGMGIAGPGFIIAMLAAWILQHFSAQSYSELACMMPNAGGIRSYTRVAMGALPAVAATILGYVIPNLFAAPAELAVAGSIMTDTFFPSVPLYVWGGLFLIFLTVTNIVGVDVFAKVQIFTTLSMMISIALLGAIGLTGFLAHPAPDLGHIPFNAMGWGVLKLTALGIWLYIGIEFVTPMVEETINPEKNIPRAMLWGLLVVFVVNVLYGFASIRYVSGDALASSNSPHILVAEAVLGKVGTIWIGIISILASASTINTVIGVVPRMLYGMAVSREVPLFFRKIHPGFRTPWIGILFMGGIIGMMFFGGIARSSQLIMFIMAACCSWLFCYIIAHIDVIVLRLRYPRIRRPYKTPFYPLPQVIGSLGMAYAIVNIAPVPEMETPIFTMVGVMAAVALVYCVVWLKFVKKQPLFKPQSLEDAKEEWGLVKKELDIIGIPATFIIEPLVTPIG